MGGIQRWCAGLMLVMAMMPAGAAELGVLAPVVANGAPQVQDDPSGRPAPVVTRVRSGALYDRIQREARDGFLATVLALDESAQRIAGARILTPTWLYLSAEDGGFARRGFWLEENGSRRFVDELFVDLVVDEDTVADGGFEEIFAHEMGHVFLRRLIPGLPSGYSRTPHSSMSVTDYPTAFDEGFATHFQSLVRRYSHNPALEDLTLGLGGKPFLPYWLSNLDRAGRIEGVRRNLFIQLPLVPPGNDAEALARANESTALDMARLKNGQQMLSSEGVIATLFHRWLVPGDGDRDSVVARYSTLFRTLATSGAWTLEPGTPVFLELVDRHCVAVPADCARSRTLVLDTTYGATADPSLARATEAVAERGRIGDMAGYVSGLKQVRAQMAQLQADVARQPSMLRAALGPDLWLLGHSAARLPGMTSQDIAVNLNTAQAEALQTLPGIDAATATRALRSRRDAGVFRDLADFVRRAGIDGRTSAALEDAARRLQAAGPYERR
ncbi:helix-hairpin-helix domain-containing protein [Lysobacter sp. LF1]|uniref:Helix-hairpin-helix domain-containing protein n=1 Tax=Lysobacter stagni TaxID=3045172 RepID=A0ABT6XJC7_9GAMM|nr:helix-hairpin-helix domain-containing protein [Lysobacter sp. LF1]MDI9240269.1 helix-hairpin-helix domain-containing protein [Lysobacter sp. LF1]